MHPHQLSRYAAPALLIILAVLSIVTAFVTKTTYDSGDSIMHYIFSRYAFSYPNLFLHHWGKPLFILFSAPFAVFGFTGIKLFQCLVAAASAFAAWKICKRLQFEYAFIAIVFLYFMPDYFLAQFSGLTEPLFGLVLVLSIFLYLRDLKVPALSLVSFLPFARAEGVIILIIFSVFLLFQKEFKYLPLLLTGFAVYSITGYFINKDILWLIHDNPYKGAKEIYGSGWIFHFAESLPMLTGTPLLVLFIAGVAGIAIQTFTPARQEKFFTARFFLIYGSAIGYFAAHSIFWWLGIFGSLGLPRVMIAIMPLLAIIALDGLNNIIKLLPWKKLRFYAAIAALCIVIIYPFQHNHTINFARDLNPSDEQVLMNEIGEWYNNSPYRDKKVFYSHPYLIIALNKDYFDTSETANLANYRNFPQPDSTILIWDRWFSGVENKVDLDSLLKDSCCTLVRKFEKPKYKDTIRYYVLRAGD